MNTVTPPAGADTGGAPAPAAASPAPASTSAPAPAATSAPSPTPVPAPTPAQAHAAAGDKQYVIPDAYKDQPWASKIKSEEDLWKQLDNTQKLIGKKTVVPDFTNAKPEEIEEYFKQTRPESADAYQFAEETDPAIKSVLSAAMLKNGVTAYQANNVIKAYQESEKAAMASHFTEEGMNQEFEKSFGPEWKKISGDTLNLIKASVAPEDQALIDKLPNNILGVVLRTTQALVKDYGIVQKDGAHLGAGKGVNQGQDINKVRSDLRTEIANLSRKPHTVEEKQSLIDKLQATYSNVK